MRPLAVRCALAASLALLLAACQSQESASTAQNASPAPPALPAKPAPVVPTTDGHYSGDINAEDFAARLKKVSSDEFEGRKPGTRVASVRNGACGIHTLLLERTARPAS